MHDVFWEVRINNLDITSTYSEFVVIFLCENIPLSYPHYTCSLEHKYVRFAKF